MALLLVVTGAPGSGKTTLARNLARELGCALLAKDTIKEPLLDVLGAADRATSHRLSNAAFAALFCLAEVQLSAGLPVMLEGNFRSGDHEAPLRSLLQKGHGCVQVLCRVPEEERRRRLRARTHDPGRHPGHRDDLLAEMQPPADGGTLALPGERFEYDATATELPHLIAQLRAALARNRA